LRSECPLVINSALRPLGAENTKPATSKARNPEYNFDPFITKVGQHIELQTICNTKSPVLWCASAEIEIAA
jgi:hypothetical protein